MIHKVDTFKISAIELDDLQKIKIRHDNSSLGKKNCININPNFANFIYFI
jgi:hypothetical protein